LGTFPVFLEQFLAATRFQASTEGRSGGGLNTEVGLRKRDEGMTALPKRKSHTARK
jgi:hypothetical protein